MDKLSYGPSYKGSAYNAGDISLTLGSGDPLEKERNCNPLQYSCLENPHGQRNLVGYHPWGHKELDMTERLSTHNKSDFEPLFMCLLASLCLLGFPDGSVGKESACNAGVPGSIPWVGKIPWACNPIQYSCLENPHGQRRLVGFSS